MNFARISIFCIVLLCIFSRSATAKDAKAERCAPYREQVELILTENGLSTAFYWLMVAESGCREKAVSKRGAVGFWQMMPATMHHYGCRDAEDLVCQTHAAAKYLASLRRRFASMREVIIAWNMGGSNFRRKGKPTAEAKALAVYVLQLSKEN